MLSCLSDLLDDSSIRAELGVIRPWSPTRDFASVESEYGEAGISPGRDSPGGGVVNLDGIPLDGGLSPGPSREGPGMLGNMSRAGGGV